MDASAALARLEALGDPARLEGMRRYGIAPGRAFGVRVPELRALARELGRDHELAGQLWATGIHEARLLATMVDDPALVDAAQMDRWAADFDAWDVCDQACMNLFRRTAGAWECVPAWSEREEPFVKRAAFALIAVLAVHEKSAPDERFLELLPLIRGAAADRRPIVRKGVSWALRQIGKRNVALHAATVECARGLGPDARWVAGDVLRDLASEATARRLGL